ncbi:hypothetical protein DRN85_09655, partial [Methanosarcinales archaeon]
MKKRNVIIVMSLLIVLAWACESALGGTIIPGEYYTWGISNDVLSDSIPDGSIITEAELTIHNVTNIADNEDGALYIHLLDNPPLGFVSNNDYGSGDFFESQGILLTPVYHDQTAGTEERVYIFSALNDEFSPLWNIFNPDNPNMAGFSSALLQLIDYAGNGTPFGFGFDPNGVDGYDFDQITLDLTVESFEGTYVQSPLTFTTTGQAGLIGYWAMDDNIDDTIVLDSSGNEYHGTAQYNTSVLHQTGIIDGALDFDGANDYINCGNSTDFDITDAITISAWVKFDTLSTNYQTIVAKRGPGPVANYAVRTGALGAQDE